MTGKRRGCVGRGREEEARRGEMLQSLRTCRFGTMCGNAAGGFTCTCCSSEKDGERRLRRVASMLGTFRAKVAEHAGWEPDDVTSTAVLPGFRPASVRSSSRLIG